MLKKHTEINSHASGITLIVRETEPSLLSFVTIFFQTAPGFFYCMALSFFFFFFVTGMGILTSLIVSSFVEIMAIWSLFIGTIWKDPGLSDLPDFFFLKHREKSGKEAAEDRSGVPEEMSGQVRN